MKTKKIISSLFSIILLFQVLPALTFSCIDDCSGQALFLRYQELSGVAWENIPGNPGWQVKAWSNEINLTSEKLILGFDLSYESVAALRPNKIDSGMPFAFACDPAINFESNIKSWELVSNKDFNDNFPAGASLNDIVLISPVIGGQFLPFAVYNDQQRVRDLGNSFVRFSELSTQASSSDFTCTITLVDGRIFSSTVENIVLRVE